MFSDSVVRNAWARAEGRCECRRSQHDHSGRCSALLKWERRGSECDGGWEAHHINANGRDTLSNCEILCQPCHKATRSYGAH